MEIEKALAELRKDENKRKFVQSVDLIINLKDFDLRREAINTFIQIPNPTEKKICGFLTRKSKFVDTITKEEFDKYKEPKEIKKLAKSYDFFIAVASLMPEIATKFGRILGPMGKMPSPRAGIIESDDDESVKQMVEKMKKLIRVRSKENSLKILVGKEDMPDEKLKENITAVIQAIENILPKKKENIKNILLKFTMTKPVRIR